MNPFVSAVLDSLKIAPDGTPSFTDAKLHDWRTKLASQPKDQKTQIAEDLLIAAVRLMELGAKAQTVVAQLTMLGMDAAVPLAKLPPPQEYAKQAKEAFKAVEAMQKEGESAPAAAPAPATAAAPKAPASPQPAKKPKGKPGR